MNWTTYCWSSASGGLSATGTMGSSRLLPFSIGEGVEGGEGAFSLGLLGTGVDVLLLDFFTLKMDPFAGLGKLR